jgi:sugar phosphate isomerase/epimerase
MKLAFSTNAYPRFSFPEAVRRLAKIGYAGVEIRADVPTRELPLVVYFRD